MFGRSVHERTREKTRLPTFSAFLQCKISREALSEGSRNGIMKEPRLVPEGPEDFACVIQFGASVIYALM